MSEKSSLPSRSSGHRKLRQGGKGEKALEYGTRLPIHRHSFAFASRNSQRSSGDFQRSGAKTHTDPEFITEYRKLTGGDEPPPLMPDEQAKIVKEIPRD